jgi:hypothetical protein
MQQLSLGEPTPITLEDGAVFLAAPVRSHGVSYRSLALVLNPRIVDKAAELLVYAQAVDKAKATRLNFHRRARQARAENNAVGWDAEVYERDELEAAQARHRAAMLYALASGKNAFDKHVITVADWRDLLRVFHQSPDVGSVKDGPCHT